MMRRFFLALLLLLAGSPAALAAPTLPGPSQGLWDEHPGYSLTHPVYVATTGSDTTGTGTAAAPWATLQHANDWLVSQPPGAVSAVVVEPGTYPAGVSITVGGAPGAYLAYRCARMDACTITGPAAGQNGSFAWTRANGPGSYVIIDGFKLSAASAVSTGGYGQGIQLWDGEPNAEKDFSVHHVWVLNSVISGFGQAGVNMNDGEYLYAVHNTVFDNANAGCSAQGSGIAFVVLKSAPGYVRIRADADNPMAGAIGSFNNAIMWNVVYNNATTECGTPANPYDSDGNNIILDTLNNGNLGGGTPLAPIYPGSTLVAFNVVYNSGGGGVHIFRSENVTVANNSIFNSGLDPNGSNHSAAGIDTNGSYGNTIINNLVVAIPAANNQQQNGAGSCAFGVAPFQKFASAILGGGVAGQAADVFNNNITSLQGGYRSCWGAWGQDGEDPMFGSDVFPTTGAGANRKATSPMWVDVGAKALGSDATPPTGANFALQPGSPAIGAGLREPYLSVQSVDLGACSHLVTVCP